MEINITPQREICGNEYTKMRPKREHTVTRARTQTADSATAALQ